MSAIRKKRARPPRLIASEKRLNRLNSDRENILTATRVSTACNSFCRLGLRLPHIKLLCHGDRKSQGERTKVSRKRYGRFLSVSCSPLHRHLSQGEDRKSPRSNRSEEAIPDQWKKVKRYSARSRSVICATLAMSLAMAFSGFGWCHDNVLCDAFDGRWWHFSQFLRGCAILAPSVLALTWNFKVFVALGQGILL